MALVDDPRMPSMGSCLLGRYQFVKVLGEGGFGAVYLAQDLKLHGEVAIKVLDPSKSQKASFAERFHQEIKLTRQLKHPNTIKVWDAGTTENGCLYMAMEFFPGQELQDIIARDGRMPVKRVNKITLQVLRSLAEAHRLGIVHRDLKPSNIMLCDFEGDRDFVKLLDFGISKALDSHLSSVKTQTGMVLCTPSYASSELLRGRGLTPASDVYSLGLIMIEMLTGEQAVKGNSQGDVMLKQCMPEPIPIPGEHDGTPYGEVLKKATAKSMEERFQSAIEMLEAISSLEADDYYPDAHRSYRRNDEDSAHTSLVIPAKKSRSGVGLGLVFIIALTVIVVAVIGYFWLFEKGDRTSQPKPAEQELASIKTEQPVPATSKQREPSEGHVTWPPTEIDTNSTSSEVDDQDHLDHDRVVETPFETQQASTREVIALESTQVRTPEDAATIDQEALPETDPATLAASDQSAAQHAETDNDDESSPVVQFTMVTISSTPEGASVFIDREASGDTPWSGQLTRDGQSLSVEIRHPGYRTWRRRVQLEEPEIEVVANLRPRQERDSSDPAREIGTSPFGLQAGDRETSPDESAPSDSPFGRMSE